MLVIVRNVPTFGALFSLDALIQLRFNWNTFTTWKPQSGFWWNSLHVCLYGEIWHPWSVGMLASRRTFVRVVAGGLVNNIVSDSRYRDSICPFFHCVWWDPFLLTHIGSGSNDTKWFVGSHVNNYEIKKVVILSLIVIQLICFLFIELTFQIRLVQ